jgi:putative transposase
VARFVWNLALAEWKRQYAAGEKLTALKLKKQFNEIRRAQFPPTEGGSQKTPLISLFSTWAKLSPPLFQAKLVVAGLRARKNRVPRSIWRMISLS